MKELNNSIHREAFRLTEAALTVAALGSMFSPEACKAAGEYLLFQAANADEHEVKVLTAMADYLIANSRMDANGNIVGGNNE